MKFLLNDTICEEQTINADLSLLRYLRENKGLTGTKEGCASGDCGACTILVGELKDDELHYHSVNACITPLHAIAGKQVLSVEHLANNNELHPSQSAMVEHHGSQCGFCTPGFVMSLTGLYEEAKSGHASIDRGSVCEAISGNLCRCTGYRPIVDAGMNMDLNASSKITEAQTNTIDNLKSLAELSSQTSSPYFKPTTETELQALLKTEAEARLIAGGTDLMLEVTQAYKELPSLIDLSELEALCQITLDKTTLHIGAAVTYTQLEQYFSDKHKPLHALFERIASRQIRNRGTIGGNIANASPIADLPPVLLALDATLTLKNVKNEERTLALSEFYKSYKVTELKADEYISSFSFNTQTLEQHCQFYKVSKRIEDDISSVMLASCFKVENNKIASVRIAFGGMAATPIRVHSAESAFNEADINDEAALSAAINEIKNTLTPMSDVRASAQYRLDIACNLLRKSWLALQGLEPPLLTISESHKRLEAQHPPTKPNTWEPSTHA